MVVVVVVVVIVVVVVVARSDINWRKSHESTRISAYRNSRVSAHAGRGHGVYCLDDEAKRAAGSRSAAVVECERVLQKPSVKDMFVKGAAVARQDRWGNGDAGERESGPVDAKNVDVGSCTDASLGSDAYPNVDAGRSADASPGIDVGRCDHDDYFVYTDSVFWFDASVRRRLMSLYDDLAPLDVEIDAYGDFLQALGNDRMNRMVVGAGDWVSLF